MNITDAAQDVTHIPIKIHSQGDLPLYLQIKYQLSYLITTERVANGARLPPVRVLATELNINPHTVAQAYRELQSEGLIESSPGRGSFVRKFADDKRTEPERHAALTEVLRSGRRRARALGFTDEEIMQRLASLSGQESVACPVVFVDHDPHIAEKYAARLEHYLGSGIRATPLGLIDIEQRDTATLEALETAYFVLAFARNVPGLEKMLAKIGKAFKLLTIVSEVTPATGSALAKLPSKTKAVLLTEERYIHSSLNLISAYSPLDPGGVDVFTTSDSDAFLAAARTADVILYTFGAGERIKGMETGAPAFELTFDISPDSVGKLRHLLGTLAANSPV